MPRSLIITTPGRVPVSRGLLILSAMLACAPPAPATPDFTVEREEQETGVTARFQAISVVDPETVWISGTGGRYGRTTNGGTSWQIGVVPGADSLEFRDVHAASAEVAWLLSAGPGEQSRIYRTADAGVTWELQFTNTEPRAFFDCLDFWDDSAGLAMSDAVDGVFPVLRTSDGGASWAPIAADQLPPALPGEGAFAASGTCVLTLGDSTAFLATGASGLAARVLRTDDRGDTWTVSETPVVHDTTVAGLTSVAWLDARRGVAVGGNLAVTDTILDAVAWTEDGGDTWTPGGRVPFPGTIFGATVVPGPEELIVAVGPGGTAWSRDLGRSWAAMDSVNYWSAGFAGVDAGWAVGPRGRVTRFRFMPRRPISG